MSQSKLTCSLGPVDQSFADLALGESGRSFHIVPVFAGEGIDTGNGNVCVKVDYDGHHMDLVVMGVCLALI
jgi:hypothetical protein